MLGTPSTSIERQTRVAIGSISAAAVRTVRKMAGRSAGVIARGAQVEKLGREHPDLGLDGAEGGPSENEDDAEGGCTEQKDDGCSRHHTRQQSPERDGA